MKEKITGLIAAPFTPMHRDGSINPYAIPQLAHLLKADGVRGAFVCGTTGEGASLTITERKQIAESWATVCRPDLKLIVHVGHNSIEEARSLAAHAQAIGADGIAALSPSYFKPASIDLLVDLCAQIAEAAPAVPFYYYHIPSMTGVDLPMPAFLAAAGDRIPTLAGIKYSSSDLMRLRQCIIMDPERYTFFFGSDEMLLGALAMGAEAAVGSTYNYAAPNYTRMIDAFKRGDMEAARRCANHAVELVAVLMNFGVMPAGKAIMAMRGVDCGPVRLPLRPFAIDQQTQLYEAVRNLGIFDGISLTPPAR